MKHVVRIFIFHVLSIVFFANLYFYFSEHFINKTIESYNLQDFLLLSITIQSGVGITDFSPITYMSKLLMSFQQLVLILTHIITLYIFVF